jgi:hypothetical protein
MDENPNAKVLRELNERMKDGDFQAGFDIPAYDVDWHEIGRDGRGARRRSVSATSDPWRVRDQD